MKFLKTPVGFIVILDPGDEVFSTLTEFGAQHNITAASFQGIGAVENTTLGYYDLETKQYERLVFADRMELVSLLGNFSLLNNKPFVHCHAVISDRKHKAYAGHLFSATVSVVAEIFISTHPASIERKFDEPIGLNLIKLP